MKIHWWRSGRTFPACGDGSSAHLCGCTAHSYLERFNANPQMHCLKCRDLASAEELNYRSDSDRYAELRKLVEAWQTAYRQNDKAQTKNNPITEVWLKHWLNLCDAQKPLLDWSHR